MNQAYSMIEAGFRGENNAEGEQLKQDYAQDNASWNLTLVGLRPEDDIIDGPRARA